MPQITVNADMYYSLISGKKRVIIGKPADTNDQLAEALKLRHIEIIEEQSGRMAEFNITFTETLQMVGAFHSISLHSVELVSAE